MKARRQKSFSSPTMAAGGIVIAPGRTPLIAIVQRRKDDHWVLPKGKLKPRESAFAGARREAREETGHRVNVHEYLGVVSYEAGGRPKIVQFWRMMSLGKADHEPMRDIKAVKWLPLQDAIARLTQPVERAFLAQLSERSLKLSRRAAPPRPTGLQSARHSRSKTADKFVADQIVPVKTPSVSVPTANLFGRLFKRLHGNRTTRVPHVPQN